MSIKPRGSVTRTTTPKKAYEKIGEPQIKIAAWCRDDKAKLPPEQVHFIIHWPVGIKWPPMVVRFKSPDTLGFIIEELYRYRKHVWPEAKEINLSEEYDDERD